VRAFVGIDVPSLRPGGPEPGRPPEHLTLRFLGEIAEERVEPILAALRAVARTAAPFRLRLEGVGAFPSPARPRVVWVGVTVGRDALVALAGRVRSALVHEGSVPAEGEFVPHLTLLRVRSPRSEREARDLLSGARAPPPPVEAWVREMFLKESRLAPGGPVHRVVAAVPLTGDAAS
jgi:RNA 2',3'-cyclic 3'-phosphodiesterase